MESGIQRSPGLPQMKQLKIPEWYNNVTYWFPFFSGQFSWSSFCSAYLTVNTNKMISTIYFLIIVIGLA